MLEDIRDLYLKALLKSMIIPKFESLSKEEIDDINKLLESSLLDFESVISDALDAEKTLRAEELSHFEAFKHWYRYTCEYLKFKHKEKLISTASSGYDPEYGTEAFPKYYSQLVDGLELEGTTLLDELVQKHCLDDSDVSSILTKPTRKKRNEQLVNILATQVSREDIRKKFIPALGSVNPDLASGFMKVNDDIPPLNRPCPYCILRAKVDPKVIAGELYIRSLITENELLDFRADLCWAEEKWDKILSKVPDFSVLIECLENKYPEFYTELRGDSSYVELKKCTCTCDFTDVFLDDTATYQGSVVLDNTDKTIKDAIPEYPMNSKNHGICVIIHNTVYQTNSASHAAEDINKMKKLFSGYGFSVEHLTDLTSLQMESRLKEIARRDHSSYDAFVCIIALGGRDRHHVCDVTSEAFSLARLVTPFKTRNAPTLAGKPKVFILPFASGPRRNPGLVIKEPVPFYNLETKKTVVPEDADIVYARGTLPGYTVSSCKRTGSWFLTNLVDVMERHGDTVDFVSCLAMVNDGVGRVEYTKNDITYTQTSQVESTLRRALYFKRSPPTVSTSSHKEMKHDVRSRSTTRM